MATATATATATGDKCQTFIPIHKCPSRFFFLQNFNIKLFVLKNSQEETDTKSTLI